ncbi:MAG: hypothetical protein KGJ60_00155 [Verrucomicrobiota bacterium]|nr:hypothetical protein [Verrucomicrobiota bacterium]
MSGKRKAGRAALPLSRKKEAAQQRRPTSELREDSPVYRTNRNGPSRRLTFIDLFCGIGGLYRKGASLAVREKTMPGSAGIFFERLW